MVIMMSGLDYSLAPIELREQLSFTKAQVGALAERIRSETEGVLGCVLLSTCNRTELYLSCEKWMELQPGEVLCAAVGLSYAPCARAFVTRRGSDAARHLMEVSGGLQSQIWGEDQILSQVKGAIAIAREEGCADPVLETLFRNAVAAGKEIKTKVRLTGVATSAAARAVEVLEKVELALPSEYLTRRDSLYQAEYYYLFEADMDGRQVAVLFGDAAGRESGEDGHASEILVVYDRSDGRMVWRGRLSYPGEYEIQGLSLLPRDGA